MRNAIARPSPSAITRPWCHSRHETDQALHEGLVALASPFSTSSRRLLMRPDAGAARKVMPSAMPHLWARPSRRSDSPTHPADQGLGGPPPRPQFRRNRAPLGAVLMAPENGLDRAPQVLWPCLAVPPALPCGRTGMARCATVSISRCSLLRQDGRRRPSAEGSSHNEAVNPRARNFSKTGTASTEHGSRDKVENCFRRYLRWSICYFIIKAELDRGIQVAL